MRQLMLAVARWGRALVAWPPSSMVGDAGGAQHGVAARVLAAGSRGRPCRCGFADDGAAMAAPSAPPAICAALREVVAGGVVELRPGIRSLRSSAGRAASW